MQLYVKNCENKGNRSKIWYGPHNYCCYRFTNICIFSLITGKQFPYQSYWSGTWWHIAWPIQTMSPTLIWQLSWNLRLLAVWGVLDHARCRDDDSPAYARCGPPVDRAGHFCHLCPSRGSGSEHVQHAETKSQHAYMLLHNLRTAHTTHDATPNKASVTFNYMYFTLRNLILTSSSNNVQLFWNLI